MIKELLKNEKFVKKLEAIDEELKRIKENKGDFSLHFPKFILIMESLLKIHHPKGSVTFDYVNHYEKLKEIRDKLWEEGHENLVFTYIKNKLLNY